MHTKLDIYALCLDGQSIAIRLAKQISSCTDCLKRAIARFNGHTTDEFEGKIYQLPVCLSWKDVIDPEGLISVEFSALPGARGDSNLLNRAIRAYYMKKRAEEEMTMAIDDMKRAAQFYATEHSQLNSHIERLKAVKTLTRYTNGCLNLLSCRVFQCECTLQLYSQAFSTHISFLYPTCTLIPSMLNDSHIYSCNTDQHDITESHESSPDPDTDSDEEI